MKPGESERGGYSYSCLSIRCCTSLFPSERTPGQEAGVHGTSPVSTLTFPTETFSLHRLVGVVTPMTGWYIYKQEGLETCGNPFQLRVSRRPIIL